MSNNFRSYLSDCDITLVKGVLRDISLELCDCECCEGDRDCTLFERALLSVQVLHDRIYNPEDETERFDMLSSTPCYDSGNAAVKIVKGKSARQRNEVKRKLLSWFFVYIYDFLADEGTVPAADTTEDEDRYRDFSVYNLFADNAEFVRENCVDCCN